LTAVWSLYNVGMPWEIKTGLAGCEGFAITKRGDSKVLYCHDSKANADKQLAALYAAEPEAYAKSLDDKGLLKAHNVTHGQDLSSAVVQLHHLIVQEMRERGIQHDSVDCPLHKAVVLKSELVLPAAKAEALLKGQPTSTAVHVDTIMSNRKKKKKIVVDDEEIEKGDKPGHAFRGNQWTKGGAGGSAGGASGGTDNPGAARQLEAEFADKHANAKDEGTKTYNLFAALAAGQVAKAPDKASAKNYVKDREKLAERTRGGTGQDSYANLGSALGARRAYSARFGESVDAGD
jgi:hypothetical protein